MWGAGVGALTGEAALAPWLLAPPRAAPEHRLGLRGVHLPVARVVDGSRREERGKRYRRRTRLQAFPSGASGSNLSSSPRPTPSLSPVHSRAGQGTEVGERSAFPRPCHINEGHWGCTAILEPSSNQQQGNTPALPSHPHGGPGSERPRDRHCVQHTALITWPVWKGLRVRFRAQPRSKSGPWDDQVGRGAQCWQAVPQAPSPPVHQGAGWWAGPGKSPGTGPFPAKPGRQADEGQASVGSSRTRVCSAHGTEVRRDSWEGFLEEGALEARVPWVQGWFPLQWDCYGLTKAEQRGAQSCFQELEAGSRSSPPGAWHREWPQEGGAHIRERPAPPKG